MKPIEGLEALLFDADGTLIDTYEMILRSMRYTAKTCLQRDMEDSELMQGVGTPLYDQFLFFCDNDAEKAAELVKVYRAHMAKSHDKMIKAFADSEASLKILQAKGYRMAVVTSKPHELAERGLKLTHLLPYFEFIIAADDYPEHKPLPGPILHACERMGIEPPKASYIGDSPYDIQAGNAAHTPTIAALWGMFSRELLLAKNPVTTADSLTEIAEVLPTISR